MAQYTNLQRKPVIIIVNSKLPFAMTSKVQVATKYNKVDSCIRNLTSDI